MEKYFLFVAVQGNGTHAAGLQAAAAAVFRDCRVRANAVPLWFKPA